MFKGIFTTTKANLISRINILPDFVSFETFFSNAIKTLGFKLVALGNPNDRTMNEKTVTIYSSDNEWKEKLHILLEQCKVILFQIGDTLNVKYELEEILLHNLQTKFYIISRPKISETYIRFLNKFILFLTFRKEASWNEFKITLHESGYNCIADYHEGAIYIAEGNNITLLTENCKLPADYLNAILRRLEDQ